MNKQYLILIILLVSFILPASLLSADEIKCLNLSFTGSSNFRNLTPNGSGENSQTQNLAAQQRVNLNYNRQSADQNIYNHNRLTAYNFSVVSTNGDNVGAFSINDSNMSVLQNNLISSIEPAVSDLLVYPNPCHLNSGVEIGYHLSIPMDVEIQIYDMRARLIYRNQFPAGAIGAEGNSVYNRLTLDLSTLNYFDLSAGAYFVYVLHQGKILGKVKIAVVP